MTGATNTDVTITPSAGDPNPSNLVAILSDKNDATIWSPSSSNPKLTITITQSGIDQQIVEITVKSGTMTIPITVVIYNAAGQEVTKKVSIIFMQLFVYTDLMSLSLLS